MNGWLAKIKKRLDPPEPHFVFNEAGVTVGRVTKYWPPWNRRFEEITFLWPDIIRVTALKWDCYIVDAIGLEFTHKDGRSLLVPEDVPDFFQRAEQFLPQVLPGIAEPAEWFLALIATPAFEDTSIVIFER
ncbi:hypothetical protein LJB86_03800 [Deltaproteobacteria bacterium OttesenSCG-928-M10]|nr:hypothetical protein [Deltaproteobacteria bacterium OttesenSCG-928-M10]